MSDKVYYFIVLLLAMFISMACVSGAPPFTSNGLTGMKLESPQFEAIKLGQDFRLHVHVINDTKIKTNVTTACFTHVYNDTGYDMVIGNGVMEFESYNGVDFAYTVSGKNFSRYGYYAYVIQCNSSNEVAFLANTFLVNPQGKVYTTADGIVYSLLFLILMSILGLTLYGALAIPIENVTTREGEILKINWKKYLKLFCFSMAYLSLLGIVFFAWNISYGILNFSAMGDLFFVFYKLLIVLVIPVMAVTFVIAILMFVNDKKNQAFLTRGLTAK